MKTKRNICILMIFIIALSFAIPVVSAGNDKDNGKIKTNADLCNDRLNELKQKQTVHTEKLKVKDTNEKNLFKNKIEDLNEELDISANLDATGIICGKTKDGLIKIKDLGSVHKLRDIRIAYFDLAGIEGVSEGKILSKVVTMLYEAIQ